MKGGQKTQASKAMTQEDMARKRFEFENEVIEECLFVLKSFDIVPMASRPISQKVIKILGLFL